MPIALTCPHCSADWDVPDNLAGKKIKCPDCTGHIQAPSGKKRVLAAQADLASADDEEDDRPSKRRAGTSEQPVRKSKQKATGQSNHLLIAIPVGVVVLIVIVAVAIILIKPKSSGDSFASVAQGIPGSGETSNQSGPSQFSPASSVAAAQSKPSQPSTDRPSNTSPLGTIRPTLPEGWVDFRHPSGAFSVYLPGRPKLTFKLAQKPQGKLPFGNGAYVEERYTTTPTKDSGLLCGVETIAGPPESLPAHVSGATDPQAANMMPGVKWTTKCFNWGGHQANEMVTETDFMGMASAVPGGQQMLQSLQEGSPAANTPKKSVSYMRHVLVGDKVYTFAIHDFVRGQPTEAERSAFYDSVVFWK